MGNSTVRFIECLMLRYDIFFDCSFFRVFFPEFSLLRLDVSTCDMAEQQAVMSARCLWQVKCEVRTPSNHRCHTFVSSALGQAGQAVSKHKQQHKKILNGGLNSCMCYTRSVLTKIVDRQDHLSCTIVNLVD